MCAPASCSSLLLPWEVLDSWRRPGQPVPVCSHTALTLLVQRINPCWLSFIVHIFIHISQAWWQSDSGDRGGIFPKIASWQDVHRLTLSSWLEGVRVSRVTGGCIVHIPRAKIGGIFQDTHSGTIDCIPRPLLTKKFLTTCSLFLDFLCPQMRGLRACVIILQPAPKQIFDDNQCKIIMIYDKIFFSSILKLNLLTPPTSLRPSIRPVLISCYVDKLMLIWSCQNSCNSSRNW